MTYSLKRRWYLLIWITIINHYPNIYKWTLEIYISSLRTEIRIQAQPKDWAKSSPFLGRPISAVVESCCSSSSGLKSERQCKASRTNLRALPVPMSHVWTSEELSNSNRLLNVYIVYHVYALLHQVISLSYMVTTTCDNASTLTPWTHNIQGSMSAPRETISCTRKYWPLALLVPWLASLLKELFCHKINQI